MIWFTLFMIAMAAIQVPRLWRQGDRKTLAAYAGTWALATAYGTMRLAGVSLPKLPEIIMSVFESVL